MARTWTVLAVTSLGVFMAFLPTTIVTIAFTDIARHFPRMSLSDRSWVLNGYTVLVARVKSTCMRRRGAQAAGR